MMISEGFKTPSLWPEMSEGWSYNRIPTTITARSKNARNNKHQKSRRSAFCLFASPSLSRLHHCDPICQRVESMTDRIRKKKQWQETKMTKNKKIKEEEEEEDNDWWWCQSGSRLHDGARNIGRLNLWWQKWIHEKEKRNDKGKKMMTDDEIKGVRRHNSRYALRLMRRNQQLS